MPNYTNPGAAASDALLQFLAQREAEKRQAMIEEIERQDRARQLTREDEDRSWVKSERERVAAARIRDEGKAAKAEEKDAASNTLLSELAASRNTATSDPANPRGAQTTRDTIGIALRLAGKHGEADASQKVDQSAASAAARSAAIAAFEADPTDEGARGLKLKFGIEVPKPTERKLRNVSPGARVVDDETGEVVYTAPDRPRSSGGGGQALTPNQMRQQANELRKGFEKDTKTYHEVRTAHRNLESTLGRASAAGDLAAIFQFMKSLDPTSTVREGEFANAQNATGVPDRIVNYYNQLQSGTRLNPAQRKEFLAVSQGIVERSREDYDEAVKAYEADADYYGIPKERVVRGRAPDAPSGVGESGSPKVGDTKTFGNGNKGQWDGMGWVQVK